MNENVVFSFFDKNGRLMDKHYRFYIEAIRAAAGATNKRIFHFGGGIRGGKTFTAIFTLYSIAKIFPGTRIHIIRESTPSINRTIKPSFFKIVKHYKKYNENRNYVELENGSVFFFMSEQIDKDKDLDRFKGLETNIFLLEQIEELSQKTFEKAKERAGTHLFQGCPAPLILTTFNPTYVRWVRENVYVPWVENKVPEYVHIEMVTAVDNPHIPQELWSSWQTMDDLMYKQYVLGDWELSVSEKAFMYAFDLNKHTGFIEPDLKNGVVLSFDFNVEPITCTCSLVGPDYLYVIKEFRSNKGINDLIDQIRSYLPTNVHIRVTGDAAGHQRSIYLPQNVTAYHLIRDGLDLTRHQILTPTKNMSIRDSRALCNTVINQIDFKIDKSCKYTIEDFLTVEADYKGEIERNLAINKRQSPDKTHFLDTVRYTIHTFFFDSFYRKIPFYYEYEQ